MSIRRWILGVGVGLVALALTTWGDTTPSVRTHAVFVDSVVMNSPQEGWALTTHGTVDWTHNGWKSWKTVEDLDRPRFNQGDYLTGHRARVNWIAQWTTHSHRLTVFVSHDSGKHWKPMVTHLPFTTSLGSSGTIITLTWFGSGAILETMGPANTVELWHLDRRGLTWQRVSTAFTFDSVDSITWVSRYTGYAVGFLPIANATPLWVTTDGGAIWHALILPHPDHETTWQLLLDPVIVTTQGLVIPEVWFSHAPLSQMSYALSLNGVAKWQQTPRIPVVLDLNQWISTRVGWGFAQHQVWITGNGGVRWHIYRVPFSTQRLDGEDAELITPTAGWTWTSTSRGTILWWTKNSGRSWRPITL